MHIGYDAKRAFLNRTGLGNYSRGVIRGVGNLLPDDPITLFTSRNADSDGWRDPRMRVVTPPRFSLKSFWRSVFLGQKLDRYGVDLFHGLSNELPLTIHKSRVRRVVTMHDLIFMRHPEYYGRVDRKVYRSKAEYAVDVADRIVAVSRQTADDLVDLLGADRERIRVIYQGCRPIFREEPSPVDRDRHGLKESYALSVGTLSPRKNQSFLLDVWSRMKDPPQLVLAGDGRKSDRADLVNQIAGRRLEDRVRILDSFPDRELPSLFASAGVLVYPSLFEGFGIPLIEAQYCGAPIIAMDVPVFREAAGEHSVFVGPDPEVWAQAITDLAADRDRRRNQIAAGRAYVKRFDEEKTAAELVDLYRELTAR